METALAMQLAGHDLPDGLRRQWAYDFVGDERLAIYLTNTLEEAERRAQHEFHFIERLIAREADGAARIKRDLPIMVVLGNPPYSGISANRGKWIDGLLRGKLPDGRTTASYYEVDGQPLGEKKLWLQDDYVKFIRWGQWRIEQTGAGILALITNHSYLDNPTFRGMRQQLMQAFTDIYVLNLHGNAKKKETCPDGSKDENVFDIQQGVTIGIFVKDNDKDGPAAVHYADLWGLRGDKYDTLAAGSIADGEWLELAPTSPYYFFIPRAEDERKEYEQGWKVTDILPINCAGIITARDHFVIDFEARTLLARVAEFWNDSVSDEDIRSKYFSGKGSSKYPPGDTRSWKLAQARKAVRDDADWRSRVTDVLYRPFDIRSIYFVPWMVDWPRPEVMRHMLAGENIGLHLCRQIVSDSWCHVLVTDNITDDCYVSNRTRERGYTLPLYAYPDPERPIEASPWPAGKDGRRPNLNPDFVAELEQRLRLRFVPDGAGDLKRTFGPEDVLHYIYAVLHAPAYRQRYAEFLRIDFPRVPLTSDRKLFGSLCEKGRELVALHLLESPRVRQFLTRYPIRGDNTVEKGHPKYLAPGQPEPRTGRPLKSGRVYISRDVPKTGRQGQYFEGVPPEVWEFHIGGYQVCEKWLKDRRGRTLSYDELEHYQKIVVAVAQTIRLMAEIDAAIPGWPLP